MCHAVVNFCVLTRFHSYSFEDVLTGVCAEWKHHWKHQPRRRGHIMRAGTK